MCIDNFTVVPHHVSTECVYRVFRNQALGSAGHSHSVEQELQTGPGFYKGQPWQKGYGIRGLFGSPARRFILLLNTWRGLPEDVRHAREKHSHMTSLTGNLLVMQPLAA